MTELRAHDLIDVLTRARSARVSFEELTGHDPHMDSALVSDVLRGTGRVGETLATRLALVEVCALVRALDACLDERITLDELRDGIAMHASITDDFTRFQAARILLRTIRDVLATPGASDVALRGQVRYLHHELRAWLLEELTGHAAGVLNIEPPPDPDLDDPRAPWRVRDLPRARAFDELAHELTSGEIRHPAVGAGVPGTAWLRGWVGVAVPGEQLGDDPHEPERLLAALTQGGIARIVQMTRARPPKWQMAGSQVVVGAGARDCWELPVDAAGLAAAAAPRRALTLLTSERSEFLLFEADEHHIIVGPKAFVTTACGSSMAEARARFLEHLEAHVSEDEAPRDELLEIAARLGRLRERAVGTH